MIGAPIGIAPIGGDFLGSSSVLGPNVFLSGTLEFQSSFRIANRVSTFLDFTLITNDDNVIQVTLTNIINNQPIQIFGADIEVSVYAPDTDSAPIITKNGVDISIVDSSFQFTLTHSDVENLAVGLYSWVAIISLTDGTRHTVNCGDIDQSTGIIKIVRRPPARSC